MEHDVCSACEENEHETLCDRCSELLCLECSRTTAGGQTVCDNCFDEDRDAP